MKRPRLNEMERWALRLERSEVGVESDMSTLLGAYCGLRLEIWRFCRVVKEIYVNDKELKRR